jgi:hypothetical protein
MKVRTFHQHVRLHKGPVNTAIYDLLTGNVYQVENQLIEKFREHNYNSIKSFIDSLESEGLIIEVEKYCPRSELFKKKKSFPAVSNR